jgi:hypothetical protein
MDGPTILEGPSVFFSYFKCLFKKQHDSKIFDPNYCNMNEDGVVLYLKKENPDAVVVSSIST